MIRGREITCDNEITDTDSLLERDGARAKTKSPEIFGEITSKRFGYLAKKKPLLQVTFEAQAYIIN